MNETPLPPGYPRHRVVHVPLRDGSTVSVRPVFPRDVDAFGGFFGRLSGFSTHMRFHGSAHASAETLRRFAEVDYRDSFSLVAETGGGDATRVLNPVLVGAAGTGAIALDARIRLAGPRRAGPWERGPRSLRR